MERVGRTDTTDRNTFPANAVLWFPLCAGVVVIVAGHICRKHIVLCMPRLWQLAGRIYIFVSEQAS